MLGKAIKNMRKELFEYGDVITTINWQDNEEECSCHDCEPKVDYNDLD